MTLRKASLMDSILTEYFSGPKVILSKLTTIEFYGITKRGVSQNF